MDRVDQDAALVGLRADVSNAEAPAGLAGRVIERNRSHPARGVVDETRVGTAEGGSSGAADSAAEAHATVATPRGMCRAEVDAAWRKSAGWPITFGSVGASLANSPFDAGALAVGVAGEVEVAAAIDASVHRPDAFVFHSVRPSGGYGDVDHVIVCGDLLVCIDAKRWAPGRYESVQGPNGMVAYRDGEVFPAGAGSSSAFLAGLLADDLAWSGTVARIIAVTSSGGRHRPVDLSGYAHPDAKAVTVEELPRLIEWLLASASGHGRTAGAVTALAGATTAETVRSPLSMPETMAEPYLLPSVGGDPAPAPEPFAPDMGGIRRAALAYVALLIVGGLLTWLAGGLPSWLALVLAALTAGAGVLVLVLVGQVELGLDETACAMAELRALRRALRLKPTARLSALDGLRPVGPRATVLGLGSSGAGIAYLLLLRDRGFVDLSRLAALAVAAGAAAVVVAAWGLLDRDTRAMNVWLRAWPNLWHEALRELAGADPRVASAALAVLVDHPSGVLAGCLESWSGAPSAHLALLGSVGTVIAERVW